MIIGNREFDLVRNSYVMGILNVTPDSFSDGGSYLDPHLALERAVRMVEEGASIIDVGGESTRPGAKEVPVEEEIGRVVPVIRLIKERLSVPVSLDTSKVEVAREGVEAGVDLINDIRGLSRDGGQMAELIAGTGLPCCLMHYRKKADYGDFLSDFMEDISRMLDRAREGGIRDDQIILDPGFGFGKTPEQNLCLMGQLERMKIWGLPLLMGTSRKSMIGHVLKLPPSQREEGTVATTVIGRMAGVSLFRVHQVQANFRALQMTDAVLAAKDQGGGEYGQDYHQQS